ncbi:glycosyltransferase family 2 protein [Patescibacteria group bacterium]
MINQVKLSIIIPVYNEEKTFKELFYQVKKVKLLGVKKEIIIVDDNSTDKTKSIINQVKKNNPDLKVIIRKKNGGKGAAVRDGFEAATGDYLLIQDADLEYNPQDIAKLLKPVQDGKAEVVYGSRFTGERKNMFFWHMMGNKLLSLVTNILYNTTLSDMEVCYKLFPRKALGKIMLKEDRWGWDPEITVKLLKQGFRIYEVPISYSGREFEEGKKISWKDGFRILWVLLKYRLVD